MSYNRVKLVHHYTGIASEKRYVTLLAIAILNRTVNLYKLTGPANNSSVSSQRSITYTW